MAVTIRIDNKTPYPVAMVGLIDYAAWSIAGSDLQILNARESIYETISDTSVLYDYSKDNPDSKFWKYAVQSGGSAKLLAWSVRNPVGVTDQSKDPEFSLLWCLNSTCVPGEKPMLPLVGAEYGSTGMPYFRVKLAEDTKGTKKVVVTSIDRPVGIVTASDKTEALAPERFPQESVSGKSLPPEPKYVPLSLNAFGLSVTATCSGDLVVITFELTNSVGGLAALARQVGSPAATAWWRNAGQFVALVREETDRNGGARWDEYHGYNYVGAYQEVPFSLLNQGKPDYIISDCNRNWTVKLTKDSGAFLHVDPPSPADGGAPNFATPVDQIVWKNHLTYCESGGLMPG